MEFPKLPDVDDKDLVIVGIVLILLCSLFTLKAEAISIIDTGLVGLAALAVGRKT